MQGESRKGPLCRGWEYKANRWVYGRSVVTRDAFAVTNDNGDCKRVEPFSVSVYAQCKDRNGRRIYVGNIVRHKGRELTVRHLDGLGYFLADEDENAVLRLSGLTPLQCEVVDNELERSKREKATRDMFENVPFKW